MSSKRDLSVWFCGLNISSGDGSNVEGRCRADALDALLQLLSTVVFLVVLLVEICLRKSWQPCFTKLKAHIYRWWLLVALQIILIASLAEGILTDATFEQTKPRLYLPQCISILATFGLFLCLLLAETYRMKSVLLLLLLSIYCIGSFSTQTFRLLSLLELDVQIYDVARFYFTAAAMILYGCLLFLNLLVIQVGIGSLLQYLSFQWNE